MYIKKKKCLICNKIFQPKGCNQKYCKNCNIIKLKCLICKKNILITRFQFNDKRKGRGNYCSMQCRLISQTKTKKEKQISKQLYRINNKQKIRQKRIEYQNTKIFKINSRINTHNYRARKKRNGGEFSAKEWKYIKWLYNYKCAMCQKYYKLTMDHIIPISKGGRNDFNNIQPLCKSCNSSKQDKIL